VASTHGAALPPSVTTTLRAAGNGAEADFNTSVFVNCPFDNEFLQLLHAMLFAIHDCGFVARYAVQDAGAAELRIDKICRLIQESRLSLHDISRIELSANTYPRFNMPFEAGVAFGLIRFGSTAARDMLLLEATPYRDHRTLSDLAGQDTSAHHNEPTQMIAAVRRFLALKKTEGERTRGTEAITKRYASFLAALPSIAAGMEISSEEIQSFDYLTDWVQTMSQWVLQK